MEKPIDRIIQKDMTRKEFLATLMLGMGSIMGFSGIIHMLTGRSLQSHPLAQGRRTNSYSGGSYGGNKRRSKTVTGSGTQKVS